MRRSRSATRSRCSASRAPAGTWRTIEPAGLPAVRLDAAAQAARARRAVRRGHGARAARQPASIRRRRIRRSRRCCTPSCRTSSSTTPTRPRCSSLIDQPDGDELCARGLRRRAWASCPTSCRASALAKAAAEVFDARSEGRRPDPATSTASSPSATSAREAYERMIEMVTLAEERLQARPQGGVRRPRNCRSSVAPLAEVAPILRGACACKDDEDRRRVASASILDFRSERRDPQFRQRRGGRALQPGRRGHARPHHPHQELAADRAGAGSRQARRFQARRARRGRATSSATTRPISRATTRASAASRRCSIRCRASCWCRGSACSGSAARKKDARDRRRSRRSRGRDASPTPRRSAASSRSPRPTCSTCEYWSLEQAKLGAAKERRSPARSRSITGAGGAIGAATAKAFAAAGAEVALLDVDEAGGDGQGQSDRRRGARGRLRRDRRGLGARGLRQGRRDLRRRRHRRSRTPARPGRAASARSTRRCCARASS